jgi:hypothetical protein
MGKNQSRQNPQTQAPSGVRLIIHPGMQASEDQFTLGRIETSAIWQFKVKFAQEALTPQGS